MTRSHSTDPVDCFLRSQRFQHHETRRIYGHILRAFQYGGTARNARRRNHEIGPIPVRLTVSERQGNASESLRLGDTFGV